MKKLSQKLVMAAVVAIPLTLGTATKASAGTYGSIAYSPATGRYGYSWNYDNRALAQNAALRQCGVRDCRIVSWFSNACGSLAKSNYGWGSSWNANRGRATSTAIGACRQYGPGCRNLVTVCSPR
ncbi:MAG: DUF4189 domain-containing protein [Prochloraceae cyanobacterium]